MINLVARNTTADVMHQFTLSNMANNDIGGVGYDINNDVVIWYPDPDDYSFKYLTFRAQGAGTFKFSGSSASNTLQYSLDNGGTWQTLAHDTNSPTVQSGNSIIFKASGLTIDSTSGIGQFISTGQFEADGNVMSLVFGDDFIGQESLGGKNNVFRCLFSGCTGLTSAQNLSLPATALTNYCYHSMFRDCTSLTTAPVLPATTLATYCYGYMFLGCTSLTTAPELPATTLTEGCYYFMFTGCTSLNYVKCLAETGINTGSSTTLWLNGVSSSGTFVKSPNTTASTTSTGSGSVWPKGTSGIPTNWTVQDA